jgi:hypothetical protein
LVGFLSEISMGIIKPQSFKYISTKKVVKLAITSWTARNLFVIANSKGSIYYLIFISLTSKLDESCKIEVKTPCGVTDMFELERIVLQGSVFGPMKCSVQMDTIGKDALQTGTSLLKYKGAVDIPSLATIDDVMGMSCCGNQHDARNSNIYQCETSRKMFSVSEN